MRKSQVLSVLQIDRIPNTTGKIQHHHHPNNNEVKKTGIKGPLLKKSMIEMDTSQQKSVKRSDLDSYMDIIGKKYTVKSTGKKSSSKQLVKKRSNDVARLLADKDGPTMQGMGKKGSGASAYPGITSVSIGGDSADGVIGSGSLIDSRNLNAQGWSQYKPKTHERIAHRD